MNAIAVVFMLLMLPSLTPGCRQLHADRLVPLAIAVVMVLPMAGVAAQPQPPLRDLASARGIAVGTAVAAGPLRDNESYRDRLGAEFGSVTPEDALKWSAVEPARGQYDFTDADRIVDFAVQHGQAVRGHTLVWHLSLPEWLTGGGFGVTELRGILKTHIETVLTRYRGRIAVWDIANEVLAEDGTLRRGFWLDRLGPDYLAEAFRWARAADPQARLYLNEYGAEHAGAKADGLRALVRDLKAQGVPIDGVGFQTHVRSSTSLSELGDVMRHFAQLGVDVAITELDVRVPLPADAVSLGRQAEVYAHAARVCLSAPRCRSITVWGFTDAVSWIPDYYFGYGAATLLDATLAAKPAYHRLTCALAAAPTRRCLWQVA
ncbi:beta-xylanase [Rhizocola hellebori]|uniref:Beta-xylanase n=1 Tax=Rhizocola hellebori TaxID=1392758 RepID=A0A8J3QFW9_9ACTN|nr:endo-1,4-beta-xylanase [Rhizocola hellebori]GIH08902.1 beta-xylanase [Rhizocola hellebori]